MRKLTLKQLLEFKNEDYYGNLYPLHLTKSNYAEYGCDYRISGTMPVKINMKENVNNNGIDWDLENILVSYAKEKHGSHHIYGQKWKIKRDSNNKPNIYTETKKYPEYIRTTSDKKRLCRVAQVEYLIFNVKYSYHRRIK